MAKVSVGVQVDEDLRQALVCIGRAGLAIAKALEEVNKSLRDLRKTSDPLLPVQSHPTICESTRYRDPITGEVSVYKSGVWEVDPLG